MFILSVMKVIHLDVKERVVEVGRFKRFRGNLLRPFLLNPSLRMIRFARKSHRGLRRRVQVTLRFFQLHCMLLSIDVQRHHVSWVKKARPQLLVTSETDIFFLVPRYMYAESLFHTSPELITCWQEYCDSVNIRGNVQIVEYDTLGDSQHLWGLLPDSRRGVFVALFGPNPDFFPSTEDLIKILRSWSGLRVLFLTDSLMKASRSLTHSLKAHLDTVVGIDHYPWIVGSEIKGLGPLLTPTSQETLLHYKALADELERDIPVAVFGTRYQERQAYIDALSEAGIECTHIGGGYGAERLSYDSYIKTSCQTRIRIVSLNSYHGGYPCLRGHVTEALASGSLLLVDNTRPLQGCLEQGIHYDSFKSSKDMIQKVAHYLSDSESRKRISNAGQALVLSRPSPTNPWFSVFSDQMR